MTDRRGRMDSSREERDWVEAVAEDLLAERRPRYAPRSPREAALLRVMTELRAARPSVPEPSEALRRRVEAALARRGADARVAPGSSAESSRAPRVGISRRQALRWMAAGVVAAILAGTGLGRWLNLRGSRGEWVEAAKSEDVREGAVVYREVAGTGVFLIRKDTRIRALSATCTHMPCPLHADPSADLLRCPCHGAAFDLNGQPVDGLYRVPLRPLPELAVRETGGRILVWIG